MEKALLIINPKAGKMTLQGKIYDIIDTLSQRYQVTVCPTRYRDHATELAAAASQQGYDIVICAGGDGTLNETVCGVMQAEHGLPIGYIPAGSTNDFAAGLHLSMDPVEAARSIVNGSLHNQDIGLFNDQRRFTYIASFGAFTETSYSTSQSLKNLLGHLAYLLSGIKSMTKIKSIPMKLICDGVEVEGPWLFGAVTNAASIGGVLRLKDEKLNFHDGIFEIILVRKPKNILQLNKIVLGLLRYEYDGELVHYIKASNVTCYYDGELSWSLDGEQAVSTDMAVIQNLHHGVQIQFCDPAENEE